MAQDRTFSFLLMATLEFLNPLKVLTSSSSGCFHFSDNHQQVTGFYYLKNVILHSDGAHFISWVQVRISLNFFYVSRLAPHFLRGYYREGKRYRAGLPTFSSNFTCVPGFCLAWLSEKFYTIFSALLCTFFHIDCNSYPVIPVL